ncbi:HlyD family secretion protein [Gaetbulibacter aestuarii]|uniref:HlyD family efflux transporter periplasmic adaptor subunit n=1 Tax=Gaetbulibacter aestuarii TaxID=1502358 RepID=A0ABW7MXM3_9FLAO
MKQIFPKEIVDFTAEVHWYKHSKRSIIIYSILLMALILVMFLLPFIEVPIYTNSRGIIKADKERVVISTSTSGLILKSYLRNNASVQKNDTLLILDSNIISEKLKLTSKQISELEPFIEDLTYLIKNKYCNLKQITSSKYRKEFLVFQEKKTELITRRKKLKIDFDRDKKLYDKGVIARVDFENSKFNYDLALNDIKQLKQQQGNQWEASLNEFNKNLLELKSTHEQLQDSKNKLVITAPASGTLLNVKGMDAGSFINAGAGFAEISPNTELLVECYVNTMDIGLLRLNDTANFQIDAFNYNQWGLANGTIIDIGKDVEYMDNAMVFKVRCSLNKKELKLKNGYRGRLKKGMTLNAQFKLTERSLFDLLYDKVDDWVNPNTMEMVSSE